MSHAWARHSSTILLVLGLVLLGGGIASMPFAFGAQICGVSMIDYKPCVGVENWSLLVFDLVGIFFGIAFVAMSLEDRTVRWRVHLD